MYITTENIQKKLNNLSGQDIDYSDLVQLQELEDLVRTEKIKAALDLYTKKNIFNLEAFLELLSKMIGANKQEVEYYYFVSRHFDYTREISEKRKAFLTLIGETYNLNGNIGTCHQSTIISEVDRLLRENIDFLFLSSDDDTFLAEFVKTPNEIILPYGNSIKYVKGTNKDTYEKNIRLAVDTANALDFPVTLKLRP